MTLFERALKHTLGIEGDYSDDPRDSGGATKYGITEFVARQFGYTGEMRDLPIDLAKIIYKVGYWDVMRLDQVGEIAPPVALEMFDTGVNCGVGVPGRHLQRLLNCFNRTGADYPDLEVDGLVGVNTIGALRAFADLRGSLGVRVLVEALNSLQGTFYVHLVERRPKDEAFIFGWFANRVLKRAEP